MIYAVAYPRASWSRTEAVRHMGENALRTETPTHTAKYWRWMQTSAKRDAQVQARTVDAAGRPVVYLEDKAKAKAAARKPRQRRLAAPAKNPATEAAQAPRLTGECAGPWYNWTLTQLAGGKPQTSKLGTKWTFWQPLADAWLTCVTMRADDGRGIRYTFRVVRTPEGWLVDYAGMMGHVWESYVLNEDAGLPGQSQAAFKDEKAAAKALVKKFEGERQRQERARDFREVLHGGEYPFANPVAALEPQPEPDAVVLIVPPPPGAAPGVRRCCSTGITSQQASRAGKPSRKRRPMQALGRQRCTR